MQQWPANPPPYWAYPSIAPPYYPVWSAPPVPGVKKHKKRPKVEPIFKPQDLIIEEVELDQDGRQIKVSTHFYPASGGPRIFSEGVGAEAFAQYRADMLDAVRRREELRELNQQSILEFETQRQLKLQTENQRIKEQLEAEREYRKKDKQEYDIQFALAVEKLKKSQPVQDKQSLNSGSLIGSQSRLGQAGLQALNAGSSSRAAAQLTSQSRYSDQDVQYGANRQNPRTLAGARSAGQPAESFGVTGAGSQSRSRLQKQASALEEDMLSSNVQLGKAKSTDQTAGQEFSGVPVSLANQPELKDLRGARSGQLERIDSQVSEYLESRSRVEENPGPNPNNRPPSTNAPKSLREY